MITHPYSDKLVFTSLFLMMFLDIGMQHQVKLHFTKSNTVIGKKDNLLINTYVALGWPSLTASL